MSIAIDLIVGLGNPGERYRLTRHNIGFWCVDLLAERFGASLRLENKFHGDAAKARIAQHDVWLLKPQTFMNLSGDAVAALSQFYKIPIERCLVIHDELDLPAGHIRLKLGGGAGGHNGLRHIAQLMGQNFLRLRMGIGHPGAKHLVTDYVLGVAPKEEQVILQQAVVDACECIPDMVAGEIDKATRRLHSRKFD